MTVPVAAEPRSVVIDTNVFGADLVRGSPLTDRYEPLIVGRPAFVSFQIVAASGEPLGVGAAGAGGMPLRRSLPATGSMPSQMTAYQRLPFRAT